MILRSLTWLTLKQRQTASYRNAHATKRGGAKVEGFREFILMYTQSDWERMVRTMNAVKKDRKLPPESGSAVVMYAMERTFPDLMRGS